jgi:hypothetical protein
MDICGSSYSERHLYSHTRYFLSFPSEYLAAELSEYGEAQPRYEELTVHSTKPAAIVVIPVTSSPQPPNQNACAVILVRSELPV